MQVAPALGITLVIKRSGEDLYFWSEGKAEEQARPRRNSRCRPQEEIATLEQPSIELEN
jgi:hypothetical protein